MAKWKLFVTTLPFVVVVLGLASIRDFVLQIRGIIEFSEVAPLLSAVAVIVAFMLAGVLTDYKESEKIPGEIAATLETIGDTVEVVNALAKDVDFSGSDERFRSLVRTVDDWLMGQNSVNSCYSALRDFRGVAKVMHQAAGVNYTIRCLSELHNLRRLITRVDVISRTSFIPAGYALLDILVGTTLSLLLLANYRTRIVEYFLIALFSLIYVYLARLIRDVDNPFQYSGHRIFAGSAEVDPFAMREFRRRVDALG